MKNLSNIYKGIVIVLLLFCAPQVVKAQKWAISTNALSWLNIGTINAEGSMSMNKHFTVHAGFTANPWKMHTSTYVELKNQQYGGYAGVRYWPNYAYMDWWIGAKVQYKNFKEAGLLTNSLMKGNALGAGLSGGYSFLISEHFNLDLGLGIWGGRLFTYKKYKGTEEIDSEIVDKGPRDFIFLDNIMVSLVYIF